MSYYIYKKDIHTHKAFGEKLWEDSEPGKEYIIHKKVNRPIRSTGQNRLFHAICRIFAMYTGHTDEEIKIDFKRERFFEWKTDKQGVEYKSLRSTKGLDTTEFTAVINNLIDWGRGLWPECVIPRKEDMHYKMLMDIDENYEREFAG